MKTDAREIPWPCWKTSKNPVDDPLLYILYCVMVICIAILTYFSFPLSSYSTFSPIFTSSSLLFSPSCSLSLPSFLLPLIPYPPSSPPFSSPSLTSLHSALTPMSSLVPILSFSTEEYTVGEGADNATVVITRQGDTSVPTTVMLNSEPINATGE